MCDTASRAPKPTPPGTARTASTRSRAGQLRRAGRGAALDVAWPEGAAARKRSVGPVRGAASARRSADVAGPGFRARVRGRGSRDRAKSRPVEAEAASRTPSARDLGRPSDEQMTVPEWEACDGCGLCCLVALRGRGDRRGRPHPRALPPVRRRAPAAAPTTPSARSYVPDCIKLTPHNIEALEWMPPSCAYRRLHEGRGLADWHPLITGDPKSVHRAGVQLVRGQTISETVPEPRGRPRLRGRLGRPPTLMVERGWGSMAPIVALIATSGSCVPLAKSPK